ncbi:MAG: glycosyltransferase [Methanomassiliicoccaceae archaeon]|jgi:1,2-diacylglycerol 3-alpha-glucosyltransferase|nr:glycosyltransferase [Methanomassiliicoccaceae archaeon]
MRIAMVTDSYYPTRDGVVTSITIAKEGLEKLGHEVVVVAPDPGKEQRMDGVYYFPAARFKNYPGYFIPIFPSNKAEVLRSIGPDIIHIHGMAPMALKALIAARNLKIPTVLTFHTMVGDTIKFYSPLKVLPDIQKKLIWIYLRQMLKRPNAIIGPSASTISELIENGVKPKRTEIIPTGIDTSRFRPGGDGGKLRERYGLIDDNVALYVGRLSFEKNIDVIVNALRYIGDVKLLIAGKGPAKESLEEAAREAGVSDRIVFAGFVPDGELPQLYAAADIFVSASRFETQGLSVLEALACGLPVACANERAFKDVIKDGVNGFLFDGGAEECAGAMRSCLSCGDHVKNNARATAESLSVELCAAKLAELYAELIKK